MIQPSFPQLRRQILDLSRSGRSPVLLNELRCRHVSLPMKVVRPCHHECSRRTALRGFCQGTPVSEFTHLLDTGLAGTVATMLESRGVKTDSRFFTVS